MLSRSWIRRFFQPHAASGSSQTPPRARLTLDALESRDVPSTIVVDNFTDTVVPGHTNLRQAVAQANAAVGDDAIVFNTRPFSPPQTIHLTGGELELSDTTGKTSIIGPQRGLTVNAGGLSRVFNVDPVVSASLSRLTITGGANSDDTGGAGVCNAGTLTLTDCTIRDNAATGSLALGAGINNNGCPLVWGHPQGPTLTRVLIEALEEAVELGGGYVLVFGCAAGDVGIASLFRVS